MREQPEIDAHTLRAAARGERLAVTEFVARYEQVVFVAVRRLLARSEDVEDIAQETFLRAFRALADFDINGSAKVSTWLVTIAIRLCIDHLRKHKRVALVDPNVFEHEVSDEEYDLDTRLDRTKQQVALQHAMAALSPEQKAIVLFRIEHELDFLAIARELSLEIGTVKSRFFRAKQTLIHALTAPSAQGGPALANAAKKHGVVQ